MSILDLLISLFGIINVFRLGVLTSLSFVYNKYLVNQEISKRKSKSPYTPFLSLIISAYNEEVSIQRTLKYIFNSTYKHFEVILINDGSTDKTDKKIKEYIKKNPSHKIIYIKQKNSGKAHALNNGIKNYAKGKLIMCLDADSILKSNAIENAVKYFRNRKVKAIATNVKIIKDNSPINIMQQIEYIVGYHLKKALTVSNMEYIVGGVGSTFRASILKRVNYYDTDTITEDIDLTMKIISLGNKNNRVVFAEDVVAYTESPLSLYALFRQRFRWKFGRFQTFWKNKKLFFNMDKKYTKQLTSIYLPFQLFSELTFLLDPILLGYILHQCFQDNNFSYYFPVLLFVMFFSVLSISTDEENSVKSKILLLFLTPFSYFLFFIVSLVEYLGLIKSIIKWKEIVFSYKYKKCVWVPIKRLGKDIQQI